MPASVIIRVNFERTSVHLCRRMAVLELHVLVTEQDPCDEKVHIELDGALEGIDRS